MAWQSGGGGGLPPGVTGNGSNGLAVVGRVSARQPGASIETFGQLLDSASTLALSLDTSGNATLHWLSGLTINNAKNGLVVAVPGRYVVGVSSTVGRDDTAWNYVSLGVIITPTPNDNQDATLVEVPPATTFDPGSGNGPTIVYWTLTELSAATVVQFVAKQSLNNGVANAFISDAYCQMHYLGTGVSL